MSLIRALMQGFGWEVGRTAAREAVDELRATQADAKRAEREALKTKRDADKAARVAKKAAKKAKKAPAAEAEKREREVDDELAELKRQLESEP